MITAIVEVFGGLTPALVAQLGHLARRSTGRNARDATKYGDSGTSPKSFFTHHAQRVSGAAVKFDARAIRKAICGRKQRLLGGRPASGVP